MCDIPTDSRVGHGPGAPQLPACHVEKSRQNNGVQSGGSAEGPSQAPESKKGGGFGGETLLDFASPASILDF